MSSTSSNQSLDELRYAIANCRQCGMKTGVGISTSLKNPGRLYNKCANHGWSGWNVPINLERENVSENTEIRRRRTQRDETSFENGSDVGSDSRVYCNCKCSKHSNATLVVMSLCLMVNILALIIIALKDWSRADNFQCCDDGKRYGMEISS